MGITLTFLQNIHNKYSAHHLYTSKITQTDSKVYKSVMKVAQWQLLTKYKQVR